MIIHSASHTDECKSRVMFWNPETQETKCPECGAEVEVTETEAVPEDGQVPDELRVEMMMALEEPDGNP